MRLYFLPMLLLITAVGAGLRLVAALTVGLGYDEVYVVALGLDEAAAEPQRLWFDIPVRRSNAVTPLWWWLLAPAAWFGVSTFTLRAIPFLVSVASIPLLGWLAARRYGRRVGLGLAAMLCVSDVLLFSAARPEYAETLLVPLTMGGLCLLGRGGATLARGALWGALLLTALSKGLFVVAGLVCAELILRPARWQRVATSLLLAAVPAFVWLLTANAIVFADGPVETDAGVSSSVWQSIRVQASDYAELKPQMVGTARDAALVYLDALVWPTTALLTPLLIASTGWSRRTRAGRVTWALLPLMLGGALLVIGGGRLGARFHLLYLPALWLVGVLGWARVGRVALPVVLVAGSALFTFGVSSWTPGVIDPMQSVPWVLGCVAVAVCAQLRWRALGYGLGGVVVLGALVVCGPLRWGPASRFEPIPGHGSGNADTPGLLARLDAYRTGTQPFPPPHDRTLPLSMAHALLLQSAPRSAEAERAVAYAQQATHAAPEDWQTWFYEGLTLQHAGAETALIRAAWERAQQLSPSEGLARRLADLPD